MADEPVSVSKKSLEEVNDDIISLFECPVCYEYLLPPIHQCKNAHNICASCKNKVNQCPTCRETFLNSRSVFVEEIAIRLFYPCKNADVGCTEKRALSEIQDHHKVCPYRLYECLIGKSSGCPWKGRRFEIVGHVGEAHATNSWMSSDNSVFYESDILQGIEDTQLVSAQNEIFWYHFKYDVQKQKLFIALQFVGPKEQASSFKYSVHVTSSKDEEVGIIFRNRTGIDIVPVSEIYESGECVTMTHDMLQRFLGCNNSFPFVLKVEKQPGQQPAAGCQQRHTIWQGVLEWIEKAKNPNDTQKLTHSIPCQVSPNSRNGEPDLKADSWPQKLIMQLIPKQIIGNIGGAYFKNSKSVLFHPQNCEALESLTKVMSSGFAGCVHFTNVTSPQTCGIKVLILFYTSEKHAYLGFIPNDQGAFVDCLRKVIQHRKTTQALMRQQFSQGPGKKRRCYE